MNNSTQQKPEKPLITELAFRLVLDSEESEGFVFKILSKDKDGRSKYINMDKKVLLEFLEDVYTKVSVKKESTGVHHLIASNSISNETIKIEGLAEHYLTLLSVVDKASRQRKQLEKHSSTTLLTHDFIKEVNLSLQPEKYGEIGIGEYRYLDFLGKWVDIHITDVDEHGFERPICSVPLCDAINVKREMEKVIAFANNIPKNCYNAKSIMQQVAKFHAMFIKAHPFRDGNGRTARLLTNYILLSLGQPITSIPITDKIDYINALNYANSISLAASVKDISTMSKFLTDYYYEITSDKEQVSIEKIVTFMEQYRTEENKYDKLAKCLQDHQIKLTTKQVIANILNNYGQKYINYRINIGNIVATQVDFENIPEL